MKTEIMIAVLALLCIGSLAAFFAAWAKLDEQKKLTQEERNRRWDEISRATGLENELEQMKLTATKYKVWFEECRNGNRALQDKLSAILCPANNHVWVDGCCVKCGMVQDAEIH